MDKVTVIFSPISEQRVTLGVWSRFAIASRTRNKNEAKDFLQWLASGDRLLRYDMTLPGHMIPALKSVREESWNTSDPYIVMHMGKSGSEAAPPWDWEAPVVRNELSFRDQVVLLR